MVFVEIYFGSVFILCQHNCCKPAVIIMKPENSFEETFVFGFGHSLGERVKRSSS